MALQVKIDNVNRAFYSKDVDNVKIAISDAICKLSSVACELGLQSELEKCLHEIHRSNVAKVRKEAESDHFQLIVIFGKFAHNMEGILHAVASMLKRSLVYLRLESTIVNSRADLRMTDRNQDW